MTTTVQEIREYVPLTASDRCDRCGAQAFVRATMPNGSDLLFCRHHGNEHLTALTKVAEHIHVEPLDK